MRMFRTGKCLSSGTYPGVRNTNNVPSAIPSAHTTAIAESERTPQREELHSTAADDATAYDCCCEQRTDTKKVTQTETSEAGVCDASRDCHQPATDNVCSHNSPRKGSQEQRPGVRAGKTDSRDIAGVLVICLCGFPEPRHDEQQFVKSTGSRQFDASQLGCAPSGAISSGDMVSITSRNSSASAVL